MAKKSKHAKVPELPLIGDVDDWEEEVVKALLDIAPGGGCVFYIDSAGGSVYGALAVTTLIQHRKLECTAVVLGECSSACLLIFAACQKRLVTRYSTFLFHRMRWQSEKRVGAPEAATWARHFEALEKEIDALQDRLLVRGQDQVRTWTEGGQYVSGPDLVTAGIAEMLEL